MLGRVLGSVNFFGGASAVCVGQVDRLRLAQRERENEDAMFVFSVRRLARRVQGIHTDDIIIIVIIICLFDGFKRKYFLQFVINIIILCIIVFSLSQLS